MTQEEKREHFIMKSKNIFGEYYDYSKVNYVDGETPVTIICPKHGEFKVRPNYFLVSDGCLKCKNEKKFLEKAEKIHLCKYDYSKVVYHGCVKKVCIICPEHGEFYQTPTAHLLGCGCPKCGRIKSSNSNRKNTEYLIQESKKIYGDVYEYSKTKYVDWKTNVCITCKKHGDFEVSPFNHIKHMAGCQKCSKEREIEHWKTHFIEQAKEAYPNMEYDYSNIDYINIDTPVNINCKQHGYFRLRPVDHLHGHTCPQCEKIFFTPVKEKEKEKKRTEKFIKNSITAHGHEYDYSKTIYVDSTTPILITCKKHGDFYVDPGRHRHGKGFCPDCLKEKYVNYTYDVCKYLAEQCDTYFSFRQLNAKAYDKAKKKKWLKDFSWLKNIDDTVKSQVIYVYIFPNNVVYIGLTNNKERRDKEHRSGDERKRSAVFEYAKKHDIEIPKMEIIEKDLTRIESQERECYWIDYYKNNGYEVLNKVKGGGLGGNFKDKEITDDEIFNLAKQCKNADEMSRINTTVYHAMITRGLKKMCFPKSPCRKINQRRNYSDEYIKCEVSKYESKTVLRKADFTLFHYLWEHDKLKEYYP